MKLLVFSCYFAFIFQCFSYLTVQDSLLNNVSNFASADNASDRGIINFSLNIPELQLNNTPFLSNHPVKRRASNSKRWPNGQWSSKEQWFDLNIYGSSRRIKVVVGKLSSGLTVKVYLAKKNGNLVKVLWTSSLSYSGVSRDRTGSIFDSIAADSSLTGLSDRVIFGAKLTVVINNSKGNNDEANMVAQVSVMECSPHRFGSIPSLEVVYDPCRVMRESEISDHEYRSWLLIDSWPRN